MSKIVTSRVVYNINYKNKIEKMKNWAHFQFSSAFIRSDQCETPRTAPGPGTPPSGGSCRGEVSLWSSAVYSLWPVLRALPATWWKVGLAQRGLHREHKRRSEQEAHLWGARLSGTALHPQHLVLHLPKARAENKFLKLFSFFVFILKDRFSKAFKRM